MVNLAARRQIDRLVEHHLDRAFQEIDRYQREGLLTEDDALNALEHHWGLGDYWSDWIEDRL